MTDHLPECPWVYVTGGMTPHPCICDRLRQAEQRVTDRHNAEHEDDRLAVFERGYAAGLTDALDKVTALLEATTDEQHALAYTNVLNTLREASDV